MLKVLERQMCLKELMRKFQKLGRLGHISLRRGSAVNGAQDTRHWNTQGRKEIDPVTAHDLLN